MGSSVFFVKQKTAYEMLRSLVGSEMCIRDRGWRVSWGRGRRDRRGRSERNRGASRGWRISRGCGCLLYTSDAADDLLCVDLGGRRIIKKKNK